MANPVTPDGDDGLPPVEVRLPPRAPRTVTFDRTEFMVGVAALVIEAGGESNPQAILAWLRAHEVLRGATGDHAAEAERLLGEPLGPLDLQQEEWANRLAAAQVHAALAVGNALERLLDHLERGR